MKTSEIKSEQALKIAVYYNNTAMNLIKVSNDITISYKLRKQAIKLAEFYMKKCFSIGNTFKLDFVNTLEFQETVLNTYFN